MNDTEAMAEAEVFSNLLERDVRRYPHPFTEEERT